MADDLSEQEIFDSAEEPEEVNPPEAEQPKEGKPRDVQGRFASKEEQPELSDPPQPQTIQPTADEEPKPDAGQAVPPGLLEERRRRQEAEQRATALEKQFAEMQGRQSAYEAFLREQQRPQEQPKPEQPRPDLFENPEAYVQHQVQQLLAQQITPIQQQLQRDREEWSREAAIKEYGEETVKAAYSWLEEGARTRDPDRGMVFQKAMASSRPYLEIVREYQHRQAIKQVGTDPNKWWESQLEQKLADPGFQAFIAGKLGPVGAKPNGGSQGRSAPLVNIPSINRASGSANTPADSVPGSEEELFNAAPRRMGRRD